MPLNLGIQILKPENLTRDQKSDKVTARLRDVINTVAHSPEASKLCELENINWQIIYINGSRFKLVDLKGTFLTIFSCQMQCGQMK